MKKMISILLLLAIICSLSTPALAGGTAQAANAPLSWAEVEPVKVFGHSEGITLTAAQTELVLANTDGELLHLPIPDGTTPSVSICTIEDSFALLLHLEEPYLILFEEMVPDELTLRGDFDRVTADSSLTTALTLIADEQSTISHVELYSPVTIENAGVIEKLSAIGSAILSGSNMPQNSLSAENTGNALEAAAQIIREKTARAIELHGESTEQPPVFLIVSGADTAVKAEAAEQPAPLPAEKEDAPSAVLPCGHMSDANGNHDKLSCGHYACAGGDHAAASCGMSGHYNCDGKTHTAAVCGTSGHYNCDGDHAAAVCNTTGHFNCDGDHNAAGCNTTGHYNCAGDHAAASCGAVGHYNCDGKTHQTPDCGTEGHCVSDGKNHGYTSCEHLSGGQLMHHFCDGLEHTWCDVCNRLKCDYSGDLADHTTEMPCGHMKCQQGDGKDHTAAPCGTSGHYVCDGDTHTAASCKTNGHYNCDGKTHTTASCGTAGHTHCDNADHGQADCETEGHYKCDGKHHEHAACAAWYNDQGLPELANHRQCDGGEHGLCNACKKPLCYGDHSAAPCGVAGHYKCDGYDHLSPSDARRNGFCGEVGHCAYDGGDHGKVFCTDADGRQHAHFPCDGRTHRGRPCEYCNQLYCVSEYSESDHTTPMPCGHMKCAEGNGDPHTNRLPCGHYECKPIPGGHGDAPCGTSGHYVCDGKTHTQATCTVEGHYVCDGRIEHAQGLTCGHYACQEGDHAAFLPCQHYACEEGHGKANCGQHCIVCNGGDHSEAECDIEDHYKCTGDHTACTVCGKLLCNSEDHSDASCHINGHTNCDGDDHTAASCGAEGHYKCDSKTHQTPGCNGEGHCVSDGSSHASENMSCGHTIWPCLGGTPADHQRSECGIDNHFRCDGKTHTGKASCGKHPACAEGDHTAASCGLNGHFKCDGLTTHNLTCGICRQRVCNGIDHSDLNCGHRSCEDGHALAPCGQHCTCQDGNHTGNTACGTSGHLNCDGKTHTAAPCGTSGHYNCDGDHTKLSCEHYACEEGHSLAACGTHCICNDIPSGHDKCSNKYCQRYKCDPHSHIAYFCGHVEGDPGTHEKCPCGGWLCDGKDHDHLSGGGGHIITLPDCLTSGHTTTDGQNHSKCPGCEGYLCDGNANAHSAHLAPCGIDGHTTGDGLFHDDCPGCNGYLCDGNDHLHYLCGKEGHSNGADHERLDCGHYRCDSGDHGVCSTCNNRLCDGKDHTHSST